MAFFTFLVFITLIFNLGISTRQSQSQTSFLYKLSPSILYATYLGGSFEEFSWAVTMDSRGNMIMGGLTYSPDFPTFHAYDAFLDGGNDWFVSKLDSTGEQLIFSTYLGGLLDRTNHEQVTGIAVDSEGNICLAGQAASEGFPVKGALQNSFSGGILDAYVAKLKPDGSDFIFATYLGGSGIDLAVGIGLDAENNIYITGLTTSRDFPIVNASQPDHGGGTYLGGMDAFVTKIKSDGSRILYSTYLGGSGHEIGMGIAVDEQGNAYVTGSTGSTDFPLRNALQAHHAGGKNMDDLLSDAFVVKFNPSGQIIYSTYLGGSGAEHFDIFSYTARISVDRDGEVYITGDTNSPDFPTFHAIQPEFGGGDLDAYVTKISAEGNELIYSTYLGGRKSDRGRAIVCHPDGGYAFVSGLTFSDDFPLKEALQQYGGDADAFITALTPDGSEFLFSTYLGGLAFENALGMSLDFENRLLITGITQSFDFPITENALQKSQAGIIDAFLVKMALNLPTKVQTHEGTRAHSIVLYTNSPNPFNHRTTIHFYLPRYEYVTLTVYDIRGKAIGQPLKKYMKPGYHKAIFDANGLPSGVYFYKLKAGTETLSRKMLLLK